MLKGYIYFHEDRIPFVLNDYCLELFIDNNLSSKFFQEYRDKHDFILKGETLEHLNKKIVFLVNNIFLSTCYLNCYILYRMDEQEKFNTLGFQSKHLDDIFNYRYNYLKTIRKGINLAKDAIVIYNIPFTMEKKDHMLLYRIGHNSEREFFEDFDRQGECLISINTDDIKECLKLSKIMYRLSMFLHSTNEVSFKKVNLYNNEELIAQFFCPFASKENFISSSTMYHGFDVMKYIPKILNNISLNPEDVIDKSIPLGHLKNADLMFSPQNFIEQIMAFEYLYEKLEADPTKNKNQPLKEKLESMLNKFPKLLCNFNIIADIFSSEIKKLRIKIIHGYEYHYDFKNDYQMKRIIIALHFLLLKMSLLYIGFSDDEISKFPLFPL